MNRIYYLIILFLFIGCVSKNRTEKFFFDVKTGQVNSSKNLFLLKSNLFLSDTNKYKLENTRESIIIYESFPFKKHKDFDMNVLSIPSSYYVVTDRKTRFGLSKDSICNLINHELFFYQINVKNLDLNSIKYFDYKNIKIIKTKYINSHGGVKYLRENVYIEPNLIGESAVQISFFYTDSIKSFKERGIDKGMLYYQW